MTQAVSSFSSLPPIKELEDMKLILEISFWVILFFGDIGKLSVIEMGSFTLGVMALRLKVDLIQRANDPTRTTADKIEKHLSTLEFIFGAALITLMMTNPALMTPDNTLWSLFATQLTLQSLGQISKRVGEKTKEDERYRFLVVDSHTYVTEQLFHHSIQDCKKASEDVKFVLENIALWVILYLGDTNVLSPVATGVITMGILSTRHFIDRKLNKDNTIAKTAALFEWTVGVTLCSLLLGNVITPDDMLWSFFGAQLFTLLAAQIAKRLWGEDEERYFTFCRAQTPQ